MADFKNATPKQKFAVLLNGLANFTGKKIPEPMLAIYDSVAQSIGYDNASAAIQKFMCDGRLPTPGELSKLVNGEGDEKCESTVIAGKIWGSVARFGYHNAKGAQEYLGPVAWAAVEAYGGWAELCQAQVDQRTAVVAQLRDIATVSRARSFAGKELMAPHSASQLESPRLKSLGA